MTCFYIFVVFRIGGLVWLLSKIDSCELEVGDGRLMRWLVGTGIFGTLIYGAAKGWSF